MRRSVDTGAAAWVPGTALHAVAVAVLVGTMASSHFARAASEIAPGLDAFIGEASASELSATGSTNPLEGKPLRYLIGADNAGSGQEEEITEVSYDANRPAPRGISIKYCNLFDEKNTGRYGPYLHESDTAQEYNEGQIDPTGPGWTRNLEDQYVEAVKQGFEFVELDNADAYQVRHVLHAVNIAKRRGLKVVAKNPLLLKSGAKHYVAHPNVYGVIVERGAGSPADMESLRRKASKPSLPVWFVAYGKNGRAWAGKVAQNAKSFRNMGVTYSTKGEYGNSIDFLRPNRTPSFVTTKKR